MKLQYKLYLFFAAVVLLPLLVATVAASVVLGRSGQETFEGRINSALAAASVIITGQGQVFTGDFQAALKTVDAGMLVTGDAAGRLQTLQVLTEASHAERATLTDSSNQLLASSGREADEGEPWLASSARIPSGNGQDLVVNVFRPFDQAALDNVFRFQGLEWGFASGSNLPADTLSRSINIPAQMVNREATVYAGVSNETVTAASVQALQAGLAIMVIVALIAALLGLSLTRTITRPLRELNEVALAGTHGDLDRRVDIRSGDEIGSLGKSFNAMQDGMQRYIGDLEESRTQLLLALSYAGEILGSTADRDGLIKTTAEAARLATGAEAIWVELFESSEPPAHHAVSAAAPSDFFNPQRTATLHRLFRSGENSLPDEGDDVTFEDEWQLVINHLVHDGKELGVLAAVFPQDRSLEEGRRKILASLADQAASAMHNVNHADLQRLLSVTDGMTGLHNFRYLSMYINRELNKSRRYGHELSLAIFDLDDFKMVNDVYGHHVGDEVLKAVADILVASVRGADMVARYGGEEFVVVFPETSKEAAEGVSEKLREAISTISLRSYPGLKMTVSAGVANYPGDATDRAGIMVKADEALYASKRAGKNRVTAA